METIRATAHDLITTIDGHLVELQKKNQVQAESENHALYHTGTRKKRKQKSR